MSKFVSYMVFIFIFFQAISFGVDKSNLTISGSTVKPQKGKLLIPGENIKIKQLFKNKKILSKYIITAKKSFILLKKKSGNISINDFHNLSYIKGKAKFIYSIKKIDGSYSRGWNNLVYLSDRIIIVSKMDGIKRSYFESIYKKFSNDLFTGFDIKKKKYKISKIVVYKMTFYRPDDKLVSYELSNTIIKIAVEISNNSNVICSDPDISFILTKKKKLY